MDTLTYLHAVLPSDGTKYCCAVYDKVQPSGKPKPTLHAVGSIAALYKTILHHSKKGFNVGVALASFHKGWHRHPTKERNVFKIASNAESMKSIWMDIDIGAGKDYPTKADAIAHLSEFLKNISLPVPLIVSSGSGLHLYWCLDKEVRKTEWERVTGLLRACTEHFGLHHDKLVLGKAASMLRPVGVMNVKRGVMVKGVTAAKLHSFDTLSKSICGYATRFNLKPISTPTSPTNEAFKHMMGGAMDWGKDKDPMRIVAKCRQIREAGIRNYEVWWAMMTVMDCCENGKYVARRISQMSPTFDAGEFDEKWSHLDDRVGGGPALCSTFQQANPAGCSGCKWAKAKMKTPATLGQRNIHVDTAVEIAFGGNV